MPIIIFEGTKMDLDKKKELIRELTDTAVRVTGIGAPPSLSTSTRTSKTTSAWGENCSPRSLGKADSPCSRGFKTGVVESS